MSLSKLAGFILLFSMTLWGCQGPEGEPGPVGPQGPQGPAGPETLALMYEVEFDLNASNKWEVSYSFPAQDKIYPEDVVLVYLLWDQTTIDGKVQDVWRLMPVNFLSGDGVLAMNYDFTVYDVKIFAEATFALDPAIDVFEKEIARIVVVPADYSPNSRKKAAIDYSDFEQVSKAFGLPQNTSRKGIPFKKLMESSQRNSSKPIIF